VYRAKFICKDAHDSDRRRGLVGDIDRPFVAALIQEPCSYCEETSLMMTLDRIDNEVGHLKTNVVPACIRCNYIRRDMPHAAWLLFVPTLRAIRETGTFGSWASGPRKCRSHGLVAEQQTPRSQKPVSPR
jgi:hypothetical protein